jgi:hypothetical protein
VSGRETLAALRAPRRDDGTPTARPHADEKPCVRARLTFEGWYVRLVAMVLPRVTRCKLRHHPDCVGRLAGGEAPLEARIVQRAQRAPCVQVCGRGFSAAFEARRRKARY